jgi:CheY-like chemotaxis protein
MMLRSWPREPLASPDPEAHMTYALIIDDNDAFLASFVALVHYAGLEVETASTWDEGLLKFQVHCPDLVIADYHLPDSPHGLQLLSVIRRLRPTVRVVLLSARFGDMEAQSLEKEGLADRAFSKHSPSDPMPEIIEEIRIASESSRKPTDWRLFAAAYLKSDAVEPAAVDEADARIKNRGGIRD